MDIAMEISLPLNEHMAIHLLREVVKGKEEFVYNPSYRTCRYAEDGKPSCIVGQVAHLAGVDIETLNEWDVSLGALAAWPDGETSWFSPRAHRVLAAAQREQDTAGTTWGQALAQADLVYASLGGER